MALVEVSTPPTSVDPLAMRRDAVLAELGVATADASAVSDQHRIDRIARLEQLRAVTAALQVSECVRFAQSQVDAQLAPTFTREAIGRGVADQIALACYAALRRHTDHIVQWREGGTTTFKNGRGTSARGNHVREMPGWQVTLLDPGLGTHRHTTVTTTSTGHQYLSHAADPP